MKDLRTFSDKELTSMLFTLESESFGGGKYVRQEAKQIEIELRRRVTVKRPKTRRT